LRSEIWRSALWRLTETVKPEETCF
jgi:hypothetical protein